jgi:ferredoxin
MKVRVDPDLCVGHGRCYALAPAVFDTDDYGHCFIENEDVPAELAEQARIGEQNCPEHAITVEE